MSVSDREDHGTYTPLYTLRRPGVTALVSKNKKPDRSLFSQAVDLRLQTDSRRSAERSVRNVQAEVFFLR